MYGGREVLETNADGFCGNCVWFVAEWVFLVVEETVGQGGQGDLYLSQGDVLSQFGVVCYVYVDDVTV